MILDASVVVALRSAHDRHAERAAALVVGARGLVVHPVTLAECLVVPARGGEGAGGTAPRGRPLQWLAGGSAELGERL